MTLQSYLDRTAGPHSRHGALHIGHRPRGRGSRESGADDPRDPSRPLRIADDLGLERLDDRLVGVAARPISGTPERPAAALCQTLARRSSEICAWIRLRLAIP